MAGFRFGTAGTLGEHAWAVPTSEYEVMSETIPRALGSVQKWLGGGTQIIEVHAWERKTARTNVEAFLKALEASLVEASPATLYVSAQEYDDCLCTGVALEGDDHRWVRFTVRFVRSTHT